MGTQTQTPTRRLAGTVPGGVGGWGGLVEFLPVGDINAFKSPQLTF